jgi:hypothetical protein
MSGKSHYASLQSDIPELEHPKHVTFNHMQPALKMTATVGKINK